MKKKTYKDLQQGVEKLAHRTQDARRILQPVMMPVNTLAKQLSWRSPAFTQTLAGGIQNMLSAGKILYFLGENAWLQQQRKPKKKNKKK